MDPADFQHLKSKQPLWRSAAHPAEIKDVAVLDSAIADLLNKLRPLEEALGTLRRKRLLITNRAHSRSAYQRGVIPSGAQRRRAKLIDGLLDDREAERG